MKYLTDGYNIPTLLYIKSITDRHINKGKSNRILYINIYVSKSTFIFITLRKLYVDFKILYKIDVSRFSKTPFFFFTFTVNT